MCWWVTLVQVDTVAALGLEYRVLAEYREYAANYFRWVGRCTRACAFACSCACGSPELVAGYHCQGGCNKWERQVALSLAACKPPLEAGCSSEGAPCLCVCLGVIDHDGD
jgi:hypothetical protein